MKANGAAFFLWHIEAGHHGATCQWHDNDHKAEVIGSLPGVYATQRWVTPPEWMELRAPRDLEYGGGEYINLYWTDETGQELSERFLGLGEELTAAGRMAPVSYIKRIWPDSVETLWNPTAITASEKTVTSAEGVLASIGMTGLVTVIEVAREGCDPEEIARRQDNEIIPAVVATGLFAGAARLSSDNLEGTSVLLYYVDADDPAEVLGEYRRFIESTTKTNQRFADHQSSVETIYESVARPSMGHYEYWD